jgi:hypothetical protein
VIILHDTPSTELSHIQAIADIQEGFALFDYVVIKQTDEARWIGQIVQPNRNVSTIGNRLDPTILHGLKLMQNYPNVQSTESVQVFDILVLGQYDGKQLLTPRIRPLPGAAVEKLQAEIVSQVIGLPTIQEYADGSKNVIGELLNADNVPLCITSEKFNYHILVTGGTGSGKSNAVANLIKQALKCEKCVLLHDAKPDYGFVDRANTDGNVAEIWDTFSKYSLVPHGATNVKRIGFYGKCDPNKVDEVVGFKSSDFAPEILAGLFFFGSSTPERNAYEGFAGAAYALSELVEAGSKNEYSLDDILNEVRKRDQANANSEVDVSEQIHQLTVNSILRRVKQRRRNMPWLDAVDRISGQRNMDRLKSSGFKQKPHQKVVQFDMDNLVQHGRLIVIDYGSQNMDDQSYALILSYFLQVCQQYRRQRHEVGIIQVVDEAHRIFDNVSRHSSSLASAFERVMREGRSVDHSIIMSLQNASQVPPRVMNNLNSKIIMRQNSKLEADAATQTMGKDFAEQSMRLGTGHALVSMYESRAIVLAQMAPSPYELMRTDNTEQQN